jgi:pimeloyl-ACP methyl ester carboxylesterase
MRVQSDGVRLNVQVDGPDEGHPVVFLHGVSGSGRTFDWLPGRLARPHRIVRVDLRGHGRSDWAPGTYLIDRYGEDVVAVLRQVLGRAAILVGHSLGAVTAWWVAQRHPELVAAAFLEDPPLYMGQPPEHDRNGAVPVFRALRETAARWQAEGTTADAVAAQLAAVPFAPDPARTMGDVMADDALAARAYALLHMDPGVLDAATDRSTLAATDTAAPVGVPLFVLAADDAMGSAFPTRHAERLAQTHPGVRVVRVPGAGHGIHDEREHRAPYVEHLDRFLAEHARAGGVPA